MHRFHNTSILLCLLILTLIVRLAGITWGLPVSGRYLPWTADESTFVSCLYRMDPFHLNLNPGFFGVPSFTAYLLAASLALGSALGWVELTSDKSFYIQHLDQRGRIFLIGRLNSVIFGTLSVWMLYLCVRRLYPRRPRWAALLAAALLAVLPGHVTWSHYLSQHPLVTFWVILTFYFLLRLVENHRPRWYLLAGLSTGIAISTNYSAMLLLPLLCLAHFLYMKERSWIKGLVDSSRLNWFHLRWLALALVCAAFGFFVVTPYALLDVRFFWKELVRAFTFVGNMQRDSFVTIVDHTLHTVMPAGLGWALYLSGIAGLVWLSIRRKEHGGEVLLLAWCYSYLFLSLRAGLVTSVSRTLPLLVFFPIPAVTLLFELRERWSMGKHLVTALSVLLLSSTAIMTSFIDGYFLMDKVRSASSAWILEHIPPASSIGVLQEPWWFSPDIVSTDYLHPKVTGRIYQYEVYQYNVERLKERPVEYIVVASQELTDRYWEAQDPTKEEFMALLQQEYKPVKIFETRIGQPPLWSQELVLANGLYASPDIVIMQRIETTLE